MISPGPTWMAGQMSGPIAFDALTQAGTTAPLPAVVPARTASSQQVRRALPLHVTYDPTPPVVMAVPSKAPVSPRKRKLLMNRARLAAKAGRRA